jgi:UDP-N-acetylmuramoylalanine--D-glutamate ligase
VTDTSLVGKKVTILGLAREGVALADYLARNGVRVTVSDLKPREQLSAPLKALSNTPVAAYLLGAHPPEILECDQLFISPGVPLDNPTVLEARRRGIPISGESRFFMEHCPAPVIGVTGSSGKTTTVRLSSEIMSTAGFRTWAGGNIGEPLTPHLDEITPDDRVVMELSSFQLEIMAGSPRIAAILNITPNHLDRHATMEDYIEAKKQILRFQDAGDVAVLGHDNEITRSLAAFARGQVALFSLETEVAEGAFLRHQQIVLRLGGRERIICHEGDVQLLGRHNLANVLAAITIAGLAGADADAMWDVILSFHGVEHRLEPVRDINGVAYFNDSIATSPERAAAALRSFERPIVLLSGGQDKHLPWDELADLMLQKTRAVVLFGQAADLVDRALIDARTRNQTPPGGTPVVRRGGSLEEAVAIAHRLAQPGDVVLLSPGGTSYDAFKDFTERGEFFKTLVRAL